MSHKMEAPGQRILSAWHFLSGLPGGKRVFSKLVGFMVPYSGSIYPYVESIQPGKVRVILHDRRRVRNHLHSVHAIALANLGELSTGIAVLTALPAGTRGIVTNISANYYKKARGELIADGEADLPPIHGDVEHTVATNIVDSGGDIVARIEVNWKLGSVRQ